MAKLLAAAGLLANAFSWGVSWWPFRQMQDLGLHPLWATTLIYGLALAFLLTLRPTAWRAFIHHPGLWLLVLAAGMTNVGFNWAVTVGDVVRVVLLFYLMPAWVVVLAWPILGERPTWGSMARMALALAGVVVVLKTPEVSWPLPKDMADWLAIMGGLAFALTNIMVRKLQHTPPVAGMLAMFLGGAVMSALVASVGVQHGVVTALPVPQLSWLAWVGGLSLLFMVGNFGLQYGAARLSASATSIIMLTEVLFASASAIALGAAEINSRTVLGGALILLASVLSAWPFAPSSDSGAHSH